MYAIVTIVFFPNHLFMNLYIYISVNVNIYIYNNMPAILVLSHVRHANNVHSKSLWLRYEVQLIDEKLYFLVVMLKEYQISHEFIYVSICRCSDTCVRYACNIIILVASVLNRTSKYHNRLSVLRMKIQNIIRPGRRIS